MLLDYKICNSVVITVEEVNLLAKNMILNTDIKREYV